jgi:hypothetical protein
MILVMRLGRKEVIGEEGMRCWITKLGREFIGFGRIHDGCFGDEVLARFGMR